ncbi:MAG: hypothetical protein OYH77_07850 [Pseudomonadota bacterium]|nr:hypothetical protein [Pseudomonadota bacterium]
MGASEACKLLPSTTTTGLGSSHDGSGCGVSGAGAGGSAAGAAGADGVAGAGVCGCELPLSVDFKPL